MKQYFGLALAMLAGAVLGAAAVDSLHAQATSGAYAVVEIDEITDVNAYAVLIKKAPAAAKAFGGRYVIRTQDIVATDGLPPKRIIVIAFDDMNKLKAWSASPAQKEVDAIRLNSAKSRQFFVEGDY
jgi:uncharacterized protein (DUF1330 family)